jgi:nucleotide-binding universal stress UspA family protein
MKNILLAFDGSQQSYDAAALCWSLVKTHKVSLTAQHVINTKGLWRFLAFQTPGLIGSGPFLSAQEAISSELRILGETIAMAYNSRASSSAVDSCCVLDEGDAVAEIVKRSLDCDLLVSGYRAPPLSQEDEESYSPDFCATPSVADRLALEVECPLLLVQDAVAPWDRIDLQLTCDERVEDAAAWSAALAAFLDIPLEIHGYIVGEETYSDLPDLSNIIGRVRELYPATKIVSHKVRFWAEKEAGNWARVSCSPNSLVVVPTIGLGRRRKTVFGGAPDHFMRFSGRQSLLFVPVESVKTCTKSKLVYSAS